MNGITDKIDFGLLLNSLNYSGDGVEVGCSNCVNAKNIRSKWNSGTLWLVDPWIPQPIDVYKERQEPPRHYEQWWRECHQFMELSDRKVQLIRDYSINAVKQFKDQQLDWVYLDANHDFEHITEDLNLWYPKVRSGGLFSGHDYYDAVEEPPGTGYYNEVKSALDQWTLARNIQFETWTCSSWTFIKP